MAIKNNCKINNSRSSVRGKIELLSKGWSGIQIELEIKWNNSHSQMFITSLALE
jgi:hypothetical protein